MGGFVIDNPYRGVTLAAVFPCLVPGHFGCGFPVLGTRGNDRRL